MTSQEGDSPRESQEELSTLEMIRELIEIEVEDLMQKIYIYLKGEK